MPYAAAPVVCCCRPVAIALSPAAAVRRHLRALVRNTPLSIRELAIAFGVNARTLERHLAGDRSIGRQRLLWYSRLRSVVVAGGEIVLVMAHVAPAKKYCAGRQKRLTLIKAGGPQ